MSKINNEVLVRSLVDTMYLTAMSLIAKESQNVYDKTAAFKLPKEVVDKAIFNFLKQIKRSCVIAAPEVVTPERFGPVTNKDIHHHICRKRDFYDLDALLLLDSHNIIIIDPSVFHEDVIKSIKQAVKGGGFEYSILIMSYTSPSLENYIIDEKVQHVSV